MWRNKKDGYINVDWKASTDPDVVYDLNKLPYPFEDNTFELIEAFHVLEHLDSTLSYEGITPHAKTWRRIIDKSPSF